MSSFRVAPTGGTEIGENRIEQARAEPGGSDGAGEGGQLAAGGSGRVAGAELSADEADLGAVSRRRSQRVTAQELRTALQSCVRRGLSQSNQGLRRVQERYGDFGPTLASEHLGSDDGLILHGETRSSGI